MTWHQFGIGALIFSVVGSFFAFVVGGWVATRIAGIFRAETGMLHGAIVWLIALPIILAFAALGAGHFFGGWYAGLAGIPVWATPSCGRRFVVGGFFLFQDRVFLQFLLNSFLQRHDRQLQNLHGLNHARRQNHSLVHPLAQSCIKSHGNSYS